METPRLFIRADADSRMGTGHVMRCLALGQAWQDAGGSVVFFTVCENAVLLQRLRDERFSVVQLADSADFFPELGKARSGSGMTWVVLDGYHFDLEYQQSVRMAGYKLLLVDDYNHQSEYVCDILLNQNVDSQSLDYAINPDALQLRGTNYAMLRREFRTGSGQNRRFPELGKKVLVTLGGADPDNLSLDVIRALEQAGIPELHAKVVVGPANRYIEQLEQAAQASVIEIELLRSVKDMTELMRWADLAVSAGGSTCWEFCCLGLPFLTIVIAENQLGLTKELERQGVARCLGEHPDGEHVAEAVRVLVNNAALRMECSGKARGLVDGFGVDRALYRAARDAGLDLFSGRLSFRNVVNEDSECLWSWANDPSVRAQCYHPEPIPWESHTTWFSQKMTDENTLMLILELDGFPVGQIRYDRDGEFAHIGFSIDRKFRGLGLGRRIVTNSLIMAFDALDVACIQAEVFADNSASNGVFLRSGFEQVRQVEIHRILSNVYVKERV